jgi:dCMP deaminase
MAGEGIPVGDCDYELVFDECPPDFRRDPWDVYFMKIARQVASRGTCHRKQVGCVIVRDRTILATGYNGSVRGLPHCDEEGHMMENGHCTRTIHAESNAVAQAARNGVSLLGGELYVTASPCWSCFKLTTNAGIRKIVYGEFYRDDRIFAAARALGMEIEYIDESGKITVIVPSR